MDHLCTNSTKNTQNYIFFRYWVFNVSTLRRAIFTVIVQCRYKIKILTMMSKTQLVVFDLCFFIIIRVITPLLPY